MKKQLFKYLFSTRLTAVLFIFYPTAMAIGTFIESWYSTDTAKIWIYNAWWFELIMLFMAINFFGNIFKYRLLRKEKWATLMIHLSFLLILLGAFVTRYIGYEGMMPIREGATENKFLTEKTYLTVYVDGEINEEPRRKKLETDLLLSEHVNNDFSWNNDFNGQDFSISFVDFMENATEGLVIDESGERYLKIVEAGDGNRHDHYLKEGEIANIHNILFTLNKFQAGAINIRLDAGLYFITSPFEGEYMSDEVVDKIYEPLPLLIYEKPNNEFDDNYYIRRLNEQICLDSWFSVVSEAHCGDSDETMFLSEKTFKVIACNNPFIIMGNKDSMEMMRKIGYKTFDGFIDESYDELPAHERLQYITESIRKVDNIKDKIENLSSEGPFTVKAGSLVHLRTDISGKLKASNLLEDLITEFGNTDLGKFKVNASLGTNFGNMRKFR